MLSRTATLFEQRAAAGDSNRTGATRRQRDLHLFANTSACLSGPWVNGTPERGGRSPMHRWWQPKGWPG
nr:hypothetical protein StreXyl84_64400 [Streptomyces sp. Xyl84]